MSGLRTNTSLLTGIIKVEEIKHAENSVIRVVQQEGLTKEYELPKMVERGDRESYKQLIRQSKFRRLCPILRNDLICVEGRLENTICDEDVKNPVILPNNHPVTLTVVKHYHAAEGHCGSIHLLSVLKEQYWVVYGRTICQKVIYDCPECRRRNSAVRQQMMSSLPAVRVTPECRAFEFVGADYFGPFLVKRNRSMEKRYGCLFTCLQIRAVHILMQFMGRRGTPSKIYTENRTSFVGAENELKENLLSMSQSEIHNQMLKLGIQRHFNPPLASHRGGVWERMIKSVRQLLSIIPREQVLSDEMLLTFMVETERCYFQLERQIV